MCSSEIRVLGGELYDWATGERVHKRAEKILAHRELDALIIECKFRFSYLFIYPAFCPPFFQLSVLLLLLASGRVE